MTPTDPLLRALHDPADPPLRPLPPDAADLLVRLAFQSSYPVHGAG